MSLIALEDVHKTVRTPDGSDLTILRGIDLRIEAGEQISVVGRSGSGKSTLLNIIGLLDTATQGEVHFNGSPTSKLSPVRRDRLRGSTVGFVFQQFNLMPKRSAVENVALPLLYERDERFWKRRRIAADMLERVGLGDRLEAKPNRLSGGEQQRVAIARALVRKPSLILADEPTGALDVETGVTIMELLDEVARETGAAVMVITHDPTIAARADRVIRLGEGLIEGEGLGPLAGAAEERGALVGAMSSHGPAVVESAGGSGGTSVVPTSPDPGDEPTSAHVIEHSPFEVVDVVETGEPLSRDAAPSWPGVTRGGGSHAADTPRRERRRLWQRKPRDAGEVER